MSLTTQKTKVKYTDSISLKILSIIDNNPEITYSTIIKHFPANNRKTVSNRLSKMANAGFIRKVRNLGGDMREIKHFITRKGVEFLLQNNI